MALPAGVYRRTIETARGHFAALETHDDGRDGGRAPAVLLPGYTGSKEDFLALLAPLGRAGHRAVAIDLRGQYESTGSDEPGRYELSALAADVLAVIDTTGRAAHLVGHSFGGFVARTATVMAAALAAQGEGTQGKDPHGDGTHSSQVRTLTLLSSGPGRVTGAATLANLTLLASALPVHDMETIWGVKRAMELDRGEPVQPVDIEDFLHSRFVRTHPASLTQAAEQLTAPDDRTAELAGLDTPTLVLYGSGEDVWAPADLHAMADRLGAAEFVVRGAGHSPAVDDPDATAAALVAFWSTVH